MLTLNDTDGIVVIETGHGTIEWICRCKLCGRILGDYIREADGKHPHATDDPAAIEDLTVQLAGQHRCKRCRIIKEFRDIVDQLPGIDSDDFFYESARSKQEFNWEESTQMIDTWLVKNGFDDAYFSAAASQMKKYIDTHF